MTQSNFLLMLTDMGDMLGAVRDGHYIEYEHDFDICLLGHTFKNSLQILKNNSFLYSIGDMPNRVRIFSKQDHLVYENENYFGHSGVHTCALFSCHHPRVADCL